MFFSKPVSLPTKENALVGREEKLSISPLHYVTKQKITPPYPENSKQIFLGLGCFWGAERLFWQQEGIEVTAVGYSGGYTKNPTYHEVCSGKTGHNEVVLVVYEEVNIKLDAILKLFFENHDPTQVMRQGADIGTQYRSAIYAYDDETVEKALFYKELYAKALKQKGMGVVQTEIKKIDEFYYAEDYHQQYLAKNPQGYCSIGGVGVEMPCIGNMEVQ